MTYTIDCGHYAFPIEDTMLDKVRARIEDDALLDRLEPGPDDPTTIQLSRSDADIILDLSSVIDREAGEVIETTGKIKGMGELPGEVQ